MKHYGPYDRFYESYIEQFIIDNGYSVKIDNINHFHHEIYLSDPRKTDPAKCKTVIRYPVNNEADINAKTL